MLLPDILAFLQRETELTRGTLVRILKDSGRLKDFTVNPQAFMSEVAKLTNRALNELIIDGVKYEPIAGQFFEMRLFETQLSPLGEYLDRLYQVQNTDDCTPYNSSPGIRTSSARSPSASILTTASSSSASCPAGSGWPRRWVTTIRIGRVLEDGNKLYLVRETQSTLDRDKRRETENKKVDCGKAHFDALGVNFKDAASVFEVLAE